MIMKGKACDSTSGGGLEMQHDIEPPQTASPGTPTGHFAVYVGKERRRFVVPTGFLSHPLFKMLLEKAYDEFGFEQRWVGGSL
ncbi:hypothetical protein ACSBR1_013288 [Camellia fascicularis]